MPALLYEAGGEGSKTNMSILAHSIIKSTLSYQYKASGPWLDIAHALNLSFQKTNNLAATYYTGQKQKKEDATRPPLRIAATLQGLPERQGEVDGKMIQVDCPHQSGLKFFDCI